MKQEKHNRCLEKLHEYNDGNNDLEDCIDKVLSYVKERDSERTEIVKALDGYIRNGSMADLEAFVNDLRELEEVDNGVSKE